MKILIALITMFLFTASLAAQSITAPSFTAHTMDKVTVSIDGLTGSNDVIAVQGTIYYDDAVIHPVSDGSIPPAIDSWGCSAGVLVSGATIYCNGRDPGTFYFAIIAPYGFTGSGTLFTIPFTTIKGDTDLDLEDVMMFDNIRGPVKVDVGDGGITLE